MDKVNKLNKLADKFEYKIKKYSQNEPFISEDPKAMVTDAFFGTTSDIKNNETFNKYLSSPNSKFQKVIQNISGEIKIGAVLDASNKFADFIVECSGSPEDVLKIKNALNLDYTVHFGLSPTKQFEKRLKEKTIRPSNIKASVSDIIIF